MAYFPIFLNLKNKKVLVIGAGNVAARKIEKLLPFETEILVVAITAQNEVKDWAGQQQIRLELRAYEESDLKGRDLVIVAADDLALQKQIFESCQELKIPCNSVDSPDYCSFIFPALVVKGDLTVGISTGGKAPSISAQVRKIIEQSLPQGIEQLILEVQNFRNSPENRLKKTFAERAQGVIQFADSLFSKLNQTKPNHFEDRPRDPQSSRPEN